MAMEERSVPLAEQLRAIGISASYASQLVNGRRQASLAVALRIHEAIAVKLGPLAGASDDDIAAVRRIMSAAGQNEARAA